MDLTEELRRQARQYRCSVCSQNMADCDISVLEQRENVALIRVTCASCRDESLFQIVFRTATRARRPRPEPIEGPPAVAEPISSDEMIDLHRALAGHAGGLKDLLPPSQPESPAPEPPAAEQPSG